MDYRDFYRDRRVLVTGALGFIGSNLCRTLADLGATVIAVDSLLPDYGGNLFNLAGYEDKVRINIADVRGHGMSYLVRDQDVLFNLAGQVSHIDSMTDPFTDLDPRSERLWRTGDGEHHHVVADAGTGEATEPEVAREAFHLRQRVVDRAVAAPRRRAEPDQPGTQRVGARARVAADQAARLERAHDRVRARVAEVGATGDLGERPRRRRVLREQVEHGRGPQHAVRPPRRHRHPRLPRATR